MFSQNRRVDGLTLSSLFYSCPLSWWLDRWRTGYFWGHSSKPQADAKRTKRLDRASEEAKKTKTGFITERDRGYLTWTLKDLAALSYSNKDGCDLTADQIVETCWIGYQCRL